MSETVAVTNAEVQTTEEEPKEEQRFDNPFDGLAYLFMVMRISLESKRDEKGLPRYVRIVRPNSDAVNQDTWVKYISYATKIGVLGLTGMMERLIDYTLYGRSMLIGIDSLVAYLEVAFHTIGTATNQEFRDALEKSLKPPELSDDEEAQAVKPKLVDFDNFTGEMTDDWVKEAEEGLRYIPLPEDLDRVGYELYRLSRVIHNKDSTTPTTLNIEDTGKLRFLAWSYGYEWKSFYPRDGDDGVAESTHFGKKPGINRPAGKLTITHQESGVDLCEMKEAEKNLDVVEGLTILQTLKYIDDSVNLTSVTSYASHKKAIKWFQRDNDLPQTCEIDNETMNRMFNLDHIGKNVKHAKYAEQPEPSDLEVLGGYIGLQNGNADDLSKEEIRLKAGSPDYPFYVVGQKITEWLEDKTPKYERNPDSAWQIPDEKSISGVKLVKGFVGVPSRRIVTNRALNDSLYEGGLFSEGQASDGRFFFAARLSEPWRPGRGGQVRADALWGTSVPSNGISRMFQDVDLKLTSDAVKKYMKYNNIAANKDKFILRIQATAMFRSLLTDRTRSKGTNVYGVLRNGLSDQGRILLELRTGDTVVSGKGDNSTKFSAKWGPDRSVINAVKNARHIDQYNTWRQIYSSPIELSATDLTKDYQLRVFLDGMWISGWDIDAYFDDVRIRWDIVPKPTA